MKTPNPDRLARRGLRFTDAHSSAATCTPSRYSLLTGEYAFRMQGARVLPGDAPALIQPGRVTLASMLNRRGCRTAAVGKRHLGLGSGNVSVSDALVSQTGLLRSFAQLTGGELVSGAGPGSENVLPALLGESRKGRQFLVEQAHVLSLRDGAWKYITPGKGQRIQKNTNTETGNGPEPQLYNLAADPGETTNAATRHPDRVKEMAAKLRSIRAAGR